MAEAKDFKSPASVELSKDASVDEKQVSEIIGPIEIGDGIIIEDGLRRGLLGRHVSLISLASVIGASCFYGFGYALYLSGPLGALLGFGIVGFIIWALMQSIGEVTTMFPIAGGFIEHATRFVDPAFSFSMAWLYYLMWSVFLGSEWNGAILILQFWVPESKMPMYGWVLVFWVFFMIITTLGVVVYGEIEYYMGWFKIISLAVCFFISILVDAGAFGNGYIGFKYWGHPTGPILNGINGFGQVFVLASAYYVGTEIISLAAGETKDPRRSIPRGVNTVVYRILFVYMGLIFFQGLICPSDSPLLINASSTVASSPFTIGFTQAGWKSSGHFINALIVVAFISAVNGCIYVQSRALYSLALTGRAPRCFAITSKKGVPYVSILTSCCWGFLALMNLGITAGQVFAYITSVGGSAAYLAWAGIIFTHLRVRSGLEKQGIHPDTYPFKSFGSIWIYRFNLFLTVFILFIQGFVSFENPFDWRLFISSYIMIPTAIILFVGYKWYHKTRWVRLDEMDFSDRLVKIEEPEGKKLGFFANIIDKLRN
ncbi:AAT family amino acid transporter, variant [Rhizodiscina lignyota]|uniref:AAT family amino acid transporter, variant n=1 Tax=Rhizodiscina lignyota TaxID=1504668 RepID=A0A9P4II42_9PEZI|nr:AAT family amino acid transporter, variant [Rhizodiscina lignyota]